jgi:hypothetical protein
VVHLDVRRQNEDADPGELLADQLRRIQAFG